VNYLLDQEPSGISLHLTLAAIPLCGEGMSILLAELWDYCYCASQRGLSCYQPEPLYSQRGRFWYIVMPVGIRCWSYVEYLCSTMRSHANYTANINQKQLHWNK